MYTCRYLHTWHELTCMLWHGIAWHGMACCCCCYYYYYYYYYYYCYSCYYCCCYYYYYYYYYYYDDDDDDCYYYAPATLCNYLQGPGALVLSLQAVRAIMKALRLPHQQRFQLV